METKAALINRIARSWVNGGSVSLAPHTCGWSCFSVSHFPQNCHALYFLPVSLMASRLSNAVRSDLGQDKCPSPRGPSYWALYIPFMTSLLPPLLQLASQCWKMWAKWRSWSSLENRSCRMGPASTWRLTCTSVGSAAWSGIGSLRNRSKMILL